MLTHKAQARLNAAIDYYELQSAVYERLAKLWAHVLARRYELAMHEHFEYLYAVDLLNEAKAALAEQSPTHLLPTVQQLELMLEHPPAKLVDYDAWFHTDLKKI